MLKYPFGFQISGSPVFDGIINFHHDLFFFLIVICSFVFYMLGRCIILYNYKPTNFFLGLLLFSPSESLPIEGKSSQLVMFVCFTAIAIAALKYRSNSKEGGDPKETFFEVKQQLPEIKNFKVAQMMEELPRFPYVGPTLKLQRRLSATECLVKKADAVGQEVINSTMQISRNLLETAIDMSSCAGEISTLVQPVVTGVALAATLSTQAAPDIAIFVLNEWSNDIFFKDGRTALKIFISRFPIWEQQHVEIREFRLKPSPIVEQKVLEEGKDYIFYEINDLHAAKAFLHHHNIFDATNSKKVKFYECFKVFFGILELNTLKDTFLIASCKNSEFSSSRRFLNQKHLEKCLKPFLQLFKNYFPQG